VEVLPLGSDPLPGPGWDLFVELLDLVYSGSKGGELEGEASEVRIDGVSPGAVALRAAIRELTVPRFTVLIHGETGTGKEVVAKEIHRLSGRSGDLVSVNVAAIPANLLEAELFGAVKGAYTGADRSRRGLVAAAEGGTLFLDEVGDLDLALQVKLLRFLESGEIRPVGADRTGQVDVRVICATHRNLERRVREGRFREDLYYRIAVARIDVPALRERLEDIPILRAIFEREAARLHGLQVSRWSASSDRVLMSHRWPGNIRELKHPGEVAMSRARGGRIRPEHLPISSGDTVVRGTWENSLAAFKKRLLGEVLTRHHGNRSASARELGISRQALLYQLKNLGLKEL
jgi:transcriptional regulator with PAS, ATPase and Fis domain